MGSMYFTLENGCVQKASSANWTMCQIEELNLWGRHDTLSGAELSKMSRESVCKSIQVYFLTCFATQSLKLETMNTYLEVDHGNLFSYPHLLPIPAPTNIKNKQENIKTANKHQRSIGTQKVTQLFKKKLWGPMKIKHQTSNHHLGPPHHVTTSLGASQLRDEDWWLRRPRPWINRRTPGCRIIGQTIGGVKAYVCT